MRQPHSVIAVAAIGKDRGLGKDDRLLWQIPEDLQRFKRLTEGHPIILGRKTFDSIVGYLGRPLPKRSSIVITRDLSWRYPGVEAAHSIEEALTRAAALDGEQASIGGGAEIYKQALPFTTKLCLTLIDDRKEADSFFPEYEKEFARKVFEEARVWNGLRYRWVDLERPNVI